MKKMTIIFVLALLCLFDRTQGQEKTITVKGRVVDEKRMPIPSVSVKIKQNRTSINTNSDGYFSLDNVKVTDKLVITHVAYGMKEIAVNGRQDLGDILLLPDNQLREIEIVSTGYQNLPKERATGSFTQPIKEAFDSRVSTDVISRLKGITSGLVFNANTGNTVNGQTDLNIRGRSTINANDQPLIVVDNFPYSGNINNINPNDVATVTILKDAAASSIWGVRAGNGVIVITTKKGQLNQPFKISLNSNITTTGAPDLTYNPNFLPSSTYIEIEKFLYEKGKYNTVLSDLINYPTISPAVEILANGGKLTSADSTVQINRLKTIDVRDANKNLFYRPAIHQQHQLNLSGGSAQLSYYFSAGYDKELQTLKRNDNDRLTLSTTNSYRPLKNLELSSGIYLTKNVANRDHTLSTLTGNQQLNYPYLRYQNDNGMPLSVTRIYRESYITSAPAKGFLDWSYVPLNEPEATTNQSNAMDTRLFAGANYQLIAGLNIELKYQYQKTITENRILYGLSSYTTRNLINQYAILTNGLVTGYNVPVGDILSSQNSNLDARNLRGQVSYNKSFGMHDISLLSGYEISQTKGNSTGFTIYGYNDETGAFKDVNSNTLYPLNPSGNALISSGISINGTIERLRSAYAIGSYGYDQKYTFTASARIDGSNYFGINANQKSVPLWSAGAKWNLDQEEFYPFKWLPKLSLSATFGYNGNLDRSTTGVTVFNTVNNARFTGLNYAEITSFGNPELRWEKSSQTKFGIAFALIHNTLSGNVDYYLKKGIDLIGTTILAPSSGVSRFRGNFAEMKGRGLDISLNSNNLKGKFNWRSYLLFSHAADRVTQYDLTAASNQILNADGYNGKSIVPVIGRPVFSVFSLTWAGLEPQTGNPQGYLNGTVSTDYAALNTTKLDELKYHGPGRPTIFGNLTNAFDYKDFSLIVNISYKFGYYFKSPSVNYSLLYGNSLIPNQDYENRWKKPGDEQDTHVPSSVYPTNTARDNFYANSSILVDKADHIRLNDISLSYTFKKARLQQLPFESLQIYGYVNNLGILWKRTASKLDPDFIPQVTTTTLAPSPRSFAFGLKLTL